MHLSPREKNERKLDSEQFYSMLFIQSYKKIVLDFQAEKKSGPQK